MLAYNVCCSDKAISLYMISLHVLYVHGWKLTHWSRVTHICVSKLAIIGSDNGLSPGRRQAIIGTNAEIFLIGTLGTNFSENVIEIDIFSFKKNHLKMSSGNRRPFCVGLYVLIHFINRDSRGLRLLQNFFLIRTMGYMWHRRLICEI